MIRVEELPRGPAGRARAATLVLRVSAAAFGVTEQSLRMKRRSEARVAFARQVAMYLLHVVFGQNYREVGAALGRERTTVAYACSLVEDERDEAAFDSKLDALTERLERLWAVERLRAVRGFKLLEEDRAAA